MNWEAVGAVGEILGAAGVIATLGYLALQIRQNTRQTQALAANASAIALQGARKSVYESAEVTEFWLKGMSHPDELSEHDYYRFRLLMQNVIDAIWDIHSQTTVTGLSPETWQSQGVKVVERLVASPGGRRVWEQFGDTFTNEFRAEIDRILASKSADN
jgi:hypothetical protein